MVFKIKLINNEEIKSAFKYLLALILNKIIEKYFLVDVDNKLLLIIIPIIVKIIYAVMNDEDKLFLFSTKPNIKSRN